MNPINKINVPDKISAEMRDVLRVQYEMQNQSQRMLIIQRLDKLILRSESIGMRRGLKCLRPYMKDSYFLRRNQRKNILSTA